MSSITPRQNRLVPSGPTSSRVSSHGEPPVKVGDLTTAIGIGMVVSGQFGYVLLYSPDLLISFSDIPPFLGTWRSTRAAWPAMVTLSASSSPRGGSASAITWKYGVLLVLCCCKTRYDCCETAGWFSVHPEDYNRMSILDDRNGTCQSFFVA